MSNLPPKKRKCDQIYTYGTNDNLNVINITGGENTIKLSSDNKYELNISGGKNNITFFPEHKHDEITLKEKSSEKYNLIKQSINNFCPKKIIYITNLIQSLFPNEFEKTQFGKYFQSLQYSSIKNPNFFPNCNSCSELKKFISYKNYYIEDIPLPVLQYCVSKIGMTLQPSNNITAENIYFITGKLNKINIANIIKNNYINKNNNISMQLLNDYEHNNTFIIYIPGADVFFSYIFYFENKNIMYFQPLDNYLLKMNNNNNNLKMEGWFSHINNIYELKFTNKFKNIIYYKYKHASTFEIYFTPNYWNECVFNRNNIKGIKEKKKNENNILEQAAVNWEFLSEEEKKEKYKELAEKSLTNRSNGKKIVPCLVYKNYTIKNPVQYIDTNKLNYNKQIILNILTCDPNNENHIFESTVKIIRVDLMEKYKTLGNLLEEGMKFIRNQKIMGPYIRKNDGQLGKMYAFGELASMIDGKKIRNYRLTTEFNKNNLLSNIMVEYNKMLQEILPFESSVIRSYHKCFDENLPSCMGGDNGITKTMNVSMNLNNPPHYDLADLGTSVSIWTKEKMEETQNWNFILPSIMSINKDENYKGLAIGLSHGAMILWNAKIRHCSSIDKLGKNNNVYGWQVTNNLKSLQSYVKILNNE